MDQPAPQLVEVNVPVEPPLATGQRDLGDFLHDLLRCEVFLAGLLGLPIILVPGSPLQPLLAFLVIPFLTLGPLLRILIILLLFALLLQVGRDDPPQHLLLQSGLSVPARVRAVVRLGAGVRLGVAVGVAVGTAGVAVGVAVGVAGRAARAARGGGGLRGRARVAVRVAVVLIELVVLALEVLGVLLEALNLVLEGPVPLAHLGPQRIERLLLALRELLALVLLLLLEVRVRLVGVLLQLADGFHKLSWGSAVLLDDRLQLVQHFDDGLIIGYERCKIVDLEVVAHLLNPLDQLVISLVRVRPHHALLLHLLLARALLRPPHLAAHRGRGRGGLHLVIAVRAVAVRRRGALAAPKLVGRHPGAPTRPPAAPSRWAAPWA
mmetsp:Transcript_38283/g.102813  ORF Transcript_38283/g.102813 Transcript_38283/m.102813 type:complete len:379 (+) Transcript_38283:2010-3146(+)